jgi:hypothetical protein
MNRRYALVLLSFVMWCALLMLGSFVSEKWHQHRDEKCFQFNDRQQRYACLRGD